MADIATAAAHPSLGDLELAIDELRMLQTRAARLGAGTYAASYGAVADWIAAAARRLTAAGEGDAACRLILGGKS